MKKYELDHNRYMDLFYDLYKTIGLDDELVKESFTDANFNKLLIELEDIIANPIITEIEDVSDAKEEITIFQEKTNQFFNELLKDDDLVLYGHGGAGKAIIESEFHCRYANLQSHFLGLSKNNESLAKLKNWPHMGCTQIAIMALNQKEFNPIYRERKQNNSYDQDIYTIPNEYFVGYYDASSDTFHQNPNFKRRHEYDPTCTIYPREEFSNALKWANGPEEAAKLYNELKEISLIMLFSSYQPIDELGYKNILAQIKDHIEKAKKLQRQIKPEQFDDFFESKRKQSLNETVEEDFEFAWDDWEENEENKSI